MAKKQLIVWFNQNGDMVDQSADPRWASNSGLKSEDAKDFDDRMEYDKIYEFTKRAARVYFRSVTTGRQYTMFLSDFADILKAKRFNNNQIEGTFHFIKKSSGQAVKLVLDSKP